MNITELAKILGISIATVSRALNDHPEVSARTRQRVRDAAKKYEYNANAAGRSLRSGKSWSTVLLLPPGDADNFYTASFFMRIAAHMQYDLNENGIDTFIHLFATPEEELRWINNAIAQHKVDALILTGTRTNDHRINSLLNSSFPFITFGRSEITPNNYSSVDFNFEGVVMDTLARAYHNGHKRIGLVTLGNDSMQGKIVHEAWRRETRRLNIADDPALVFWGEISEKSGFAAMRYFHELGSNAPDYILCISDLQAVGASFYSASSGFRRPLCAAVFSSEIPAFLDTRPEGYDVPYAPVGRAMAGLVLESLEKCPSREVLCDLTFNARKTHTVDEGK